MAVNAALPDNKDRRPVNGRDIFDAGGAANTRRFIARLLAWAMLPATIMGVLDVAIFAGRCALVLAAYGLACWIGG